MEFTESRCYLSRALDPLATASGSVLRFRVNSEVFVESGGSYLGSEFFAQLAVGVFS